MMCVPWMMDGWMGDVTGSVVGLYRIQHFRRSVLCLFVEVTVPTRTPISLSFCWGDGVHTDSHLSFFLLRWRCPHGLPSLFFLSLSFVMFFVVPKGAAISSGKNHATYAHIQWFNDDQTEAQFAMGFSDPGTWHWVTAHLLTLISHQGGRDTTVSRRCQWLVTLAPNNSDRGSLVRRIPPLFEGHDIAAIDQRPFSSLLVSLFPPPLVWMNANETLYPVP